MSKVSSAAVLVKTEVIEKFEINAPMMTMMLMLMMMINNDLELPVLQLFDLIEIF